MASGQCADCQEHHETLHDIRKRNLCTACFTRYVNSKILKRMESYRIKNQEGHERPKLFLPLSGGVSSQVLLAVLDAQCKKQYSKQGRTAYDIVVAYIDVTGQHSDTGPQWYQQTYYNYGMHTYNRTLSIWDAFTTDVSLEEELQTLGLKRALNMSDEDFYTFCISSATSVTSRSDLQQMILTRFLVALTKKERCSSTLYGHSDSRLAALSLAAVAKGRGGAVPASIADGLNAGYGISLNYPTRDLFKTELELYAQIQDPPIIYVPDDVKETKNVPSIRNTSIDDLLTQYITSQGEKYPSIMANVVKTTGKLQTTESNASSGQTYCRLCRGTMLSDPTDSTTSELCYGCLRLKQDIKIS